MSGRLGPGALCAAACLLVAAPARADGDYAPGSREWNGLATLLDLGQEAGCELEPADALDWSTLEATDVLWLLYPRAEVDPGKLRRFLAAGGRVVVADDFGAAAAALESLGIRRARPLPGGDGLERYDKNPQLPIAHARLQTPLGRSTAQLVANHPAAFATAMPATFELQPGAALVVEGRVGRGQLVALADPSVLINNMLEIEGNRAFAKGLIEATCRPGRDRILLYTQVFASQGEPPAALADVGAEASGPFAEFNTMLGRADGRVQQLAAQPAVLWAAGMLVLGAILALAANCFPQRALIRDRWTRVGRLLEPGAEESAPGWELAPDPQTAAGILREEVLERLGARLGEALDFDRLGPKALERKVSSALGPEPARRAVEVWRLLHQHTWRVVDGSGDPQPDERVTRRTLTALHQAAVRLFASLET